MTATEFIYGILAQVKMTVSMKGDEASKTKKLNNLYKIISQ